MVRLKQIKKIGNSGGILFTQFDMRDLKLKVGDWIDIEDIVKVKEKSR